MRFENPDGLDGKNYPNISCHFFRGPEERNNWLRDLITGNQNAGISTLWQREK